MSQEFLDDRRRALEEAFFARQGDEWRRQQREAKEAGSRRASISAATGISDPALLDRLGGLGLEGDGVAALALIPLVLVAWADGSIAEEERRAVLSRAAEAGIASGSEGHTLLESWLAKPPPPALLTAWTEYVRASAAALSPEARQALKADLLGRARRVASASGGGLLGFGSKVSSAEEAVLAKLEAAFG